ncbi:MAG: ABC transporter permease [Planctomycetaceae bacterium]|nr:ABC transporter permease [Planctomycetaceae bacterium]
MPTVKRLLAATLPPILLFAAVTAVWQIVVEVRDIPGYLLPGPLAVAKAAWTKREQLGGAFGLTAAAALCGFGLSLAVGTLIAAAFSTWRLVRASGYPYAIFLQTVPIVAIAPLIVIWFGYGFGSVVIVSFIISLFPVITNMTTGLTKVDRDLLDLFQLHNATRWQILFKLRLPSSVPYLVTGARISCGMAVVGAIVGEFFAGLGSTRAGLGYLISRAGDQTNTAELFAAVIASTLLGILVFTTVNLAGATILSRWYHA